MKLFGKNTFVSFWGIESTQTFPEGYLAGAAAQSLLGNRARSPEDWEGLMALILGEGQFGPGHFDLKGLRRLYYAVRPVLPPWVRSLLHKSASRGQARQAGLSWPVEDRYATLQFQLACDYLVRGQRKTLDYVHFWPHGKRFAFVLTHDVEAGSGQSFVREVAALEEKYGFRSSFNFVPEGYRVDAGLRAELSKRGFEIGVHGLTHDGRLFSSRAVFDARAKKINRYLKEWESVGFRSPMTHRNPEWMQSLDIEYDSSFFDTDPFEPIPGGTMSIWPFQMGHFIELPYTLAQDHTLMNTLGEKRPTIWLEKVEFIRKYCGMALVNSHPDYLRKPAYFAIYEDFLGQMDAMKDYWHALPRDVARWWKRRAELDLRGINGEPQSTLPGATIGTISIGKNGQKPEIVVEALANNAGTV